MYPDGFIKRIRTQEYIDSEELLKALDEPSPVSIRTNPGKWLKIPVNSLPVQWCKNGYYLDSRPSFTLDPLYHSGCYYPQEASGMFLEEIFNQVFNKSEGLKVLDLCGAPGGKSTHIASMAGRNSLLVSNEVIRQRAFILAENITRWGTSNTIVTQNDPSDFGRLTGFFDVILVDAPCSGEGMFRDRIARREWSEDNASHCSLRQKRILMDVWPCLKENGILIYSTCTFNPEENEHNVKWLSGKADAETVKLNDINYTGISEFDYKGITCYGFYPGKVKGEGLFFSILRKYGNPGKVLKAVRNMDFKTVSREELTAAMGYTDFPEDQLVRKGDQVIALPGSLPEVQPLLSNLRLIKTGTVLYGVKKKDFIPSHELAISSGLAGKAFPALETDLEQALQYLKRGNLHLFNVPAGWFLIKFKGINLGFANNIGSRINNYYPVEYRIRMNIPDISQIDLIEWKN